MLYEFDMKSGGGTDTDSPEEVSPNFEPLFRAASSLAEVGNLICDAVVKKLSRTLGTPQEDIDTTRPMHYYGVDSLIAVELRNWFGKDMSADVAIFDILSGASISTVSLIVAGRSKFLETTVVDHSKLKEEDT